MGELIVVTGPPGAGKSTVAAALAARFDPSALIAGDAFFGFLAMGAIEPWLPESKEQNEVVIRATAAATAEFVAGGYTTVFDGIVGPWFLPTFAATVGVPMLHYVLLQPSVERCLERVATRPDHEFDDPAATRKMHAEFSGAEIDPRHVVRDPPDGVDAVADVLAAGIRTDRYRYSVSGEARA